MQSGPGGTDAAAITSRQFLTFALGEEEYGIDILKVQEIKGYSAITPIPNTPDYIKGVMNLRGAVVPVLDLRTRFGMASAAYDQFTVIVIATIGTRVLGLVVDAVSDVLTVAPGDLTAPPELGLQVDTSFLTGLAKVGEKLVLLLDIDRAVADEQLMATLA